MMQNIISRKEAIEKGLKQYFTNKPCKNGHISIRSVSSRSCYECINIRSKDDYQKNKEHRKEINRKSQHKNYFKNKNKILQRGIKWAKNNREKSNAIKKRWRTKNIEWVRKDARDKAKMKRKDPIYRLCKNMSKAIWAFLKEEKGYRHWEDLVSYTFEDAKIHLENKFNSNMNWDNYGSYWEIDHIKPQSLCDTFEEAWALENLQPLECSKNRSKCNRFIG